MHIHIRWCRHDFEPQNSRFNLKTLAILLLADLAFAVLTPEPDILTKVNIPSF